MIEEDDRNRLDTSSLQVNELVMLMKVFILFAARRRRRKANVTVQWDWSIKKKSVEDMCELTVAAAVSDSSL
jgi:hypothetical protein